MASAPGDSGDDVFRELRLRARNLYNTRPGASKAAVRDAVVTVFEEADRVLGSDWLAVKAALESFVADINRTGGIYRPTDDCPIPVGDPTWSDLAYSYIHACCALGVKPKVARTKPSYRQP